MTIGASKALPFAEDDLSMFVDDFFAPTDFGSGETHRHGGFESAPSRESSPPCGTLPPRQV